MKKIFLTALSCLMIMLQACTDKVEPVPDPEPTPGGPDEEEVEPLKKVPFTKGFNLTDWLNTTDDSWFVADKYTEQDFKDMKTLGVDVVRLPINFPLFMGEAPAYTFQKRLLDVVDNAVAWAEKQGMYIILDQHSYFAATPFPEEFGEDLVASGLRQLAARYKDKEHVILELFNEPGGTYIEEHWNEMQQRLIADIRNIDKKIIIVATAPYCSIKKLTELPDIKDNRLIYTFHYYTPFLFTHQGAEWNKMQYMTNVPFPYDADKMPQMPEQFNGDDEYEGYYNTYSSQGNDMFIRTDLMEVYSWAANNDKLVFCGEFGTLNSASKRDRNNWYKAVCDNFATCEIPWIAWEYSSSSKTNFGVFNGPKNFELSLNAELISAMGLTVPPQYASGYPPVVYYDDGMPGWWSQGSIWDGYTPKIDFACTENPYEGSSKCIKWEVDHAWGGLTMSVWPLADYTEQYNGGANLEFAIRTTDDIDKLIVRLVQLKGMNWRIISELTTNGQNTDTNHTPYQFDNDGQWHLIQIPLKDLWYCGGQNQPYWKLAPDEGEEGFAWDCVQHLEFAPEGNNGLVGKTIYIDKIVIR